MLNLRPKKCLTRWISSSSFTFRNLCFWRCNCILIVISYRLLKLKINDSNCFLNFEDILITLYMTICRQITCFISLLFLFTFIWKTIVKLENSISINGLLVWRVFLTCAVRFLNKVNFNKKSVFIYLSFSNTEKFKVSSLFTIKLLLVT